MWSSAVTVSGPEAEPVPLDVAKEFLRIDADDDTHDTTLEITIAGVRDDVERLTGTRLITQDVVVAADDFSDLRHLPIGPIEAIASIVYDDVEGAEQTIDPQRYELFGGGLQHGIRTRAGQGWPQDVRRAAGAIRVTATVGYGPTEHDIPQGLYLTLLRAVKAGFEGQPFALELMLSNYRIWL